MVRRSVHSGGEHSLGRVTRPNQPGGAQYIQVRSPADAGTDRGDHRSGRRPRRHRRRAARQEHREVERHREERGRLVRHQEQQGEGRRRQRVDARQGASAAVADSSNALAGHTRFSVHVPRRRGSGRGEVRSVHPDRQLHHRRRRRDDDSLLELETSAANSAMDTNSEDEAEDFDPGTEADVLHLRPRRHRQS